MTALFLQEIYKWDKPVTEHRGVPLSYFYRYSSVAAHIKILFLSDFRKKGEIFTPEVNDLFLKIVSAIKLSKSDYQVDVLYDSEVDKDIYLPSLYDRLWQIKAATVITLGANATFAFFEKKERLSQIHGHIFTRTIVRDALSFSFQVVPLFHPTYLLNNREMKVSMWEDLKKLMAKQII